MLKQWCVLVLSSCFVFSDIRLANYSWEENLKWVYPQRNKSNFDDLEYVGRSREIGTLVTDLKFGTTVFERSKSPYILKKDVIVETGSKLIIQAGVVVKSYPGVGIYVKGILIAQGDANGPIVLTSMSATPKPVSFVHPKIRLVDGPSIATGRLQIFHRRKWQSVCTISRKWTEKDFDTACRQLGFHGGKLWKWLPREDMVKPRLLYEEPQCTGTEESLFNCNWSSQNMEGGVCDGHPDLGIQCIEQYSSTFNVENHWKGLKFDNAEFELVQTEDTAHREFKSYSVLEFTEISYGGVGYNRSAVSALQVIGAPPKMKEVIVTHSAYNGFNITMPTGPVKLADCQARSNRGYGIYINTHSEPITLDSCSIMQNGGDGVKFVHQEKTRTELLNYFSFNDLCSLLEGYNQIYPMYIKAMSDQHSKSDQNCFKVLKTIPGQVFTLNILGMWSEYLSEHSSVIEVYDGADQKEMLLATVKIMNGVQVPSIVSTSNILGIKFKTIPGSQTSVFMKLSSLNDKYYDFLSENTKFGINGGHGISVENPMSMVKLKHNFFWNNNITGISVMHGVAEMNFAESYVAANADNGISLLHLHGKMVVINSVISLNRQHGIVIHTSKDKVSQIFHNETMDVKGTHIAKNEEYGLFMEHACGYSSLNISRNAFHKNGNNGLKITSSAATGHGILNLQVVHNKFLENQRPAVYIEPAVNIKGQIEHNNFSSNAHGCILISNQADTSLENFPTDIAVRNNTFESNQGTFVVNFALSPYSTTQSIIFTKNYVKNNFINEPFQQRNLMPRNKVAAVVIINSSNVAVFLNVIENPLSTYEIGTHLNDHNEVINCTYNWLGYKEEDKIFPKIFDRSKRYNLAQLEYFPFLQNNETKSKGTLSKGIQRKHFRTPDSNLIGGEVDGIEYLRKGDYIVHRDIHVLPGSKLVLEPGVTLRFLSSIGVLVSGQLEAIGEKNNEILFTLDTTEAITSKPEVQLIGGKTNLEGQLQVYIGNQRGTVCNKGWSMTDAALVCHSMGLILNPDDWFLKKTDVPGASDLLPILLSNVQCNEDDVDILDCKSEVVSEFENSCTHEHDVAVRCYEPAWAGIRFGLLAEKTEIQFVTVEKAGLFDYSTHSFTPAIQIDFFHHLINDTKVINNLHHGLEIVYTDAYSEGINIVENSTFENNGGNGIYIHQIGFTISGSTLKNNKMAGIHYNPSFKHYEEKELAMWSKIQPSQNVNPSAKYRSILVPEHHKETIHMRAEETIIIVTKKLGNEPITWLLQIECEWTHFIAVQVLNQIKRESTEEMVIYDISDSSNGSREWRISNDMTRLNVITMTSEVLLQYTSGTNGLGDVILAISTVSVFLHENLQRKGEDPITSLTVSYTIITGNKNAFRASYFKRCQNGSDTSLSKTRESIVLSFSLLSYSKEEVIYVDSPVADDCHSDKISVTFNVSHSYIENNAKGIHHHSGIHETSDSIFFWIIQDSSMLHNEGTFELSLPYKRHQSEPTTHTVSVVHSVFSDNSNFGFHIYGGSAQLNITRNLFQNNLCTTGLISLQGMEKDISIHHNYVLHNHGIYMFEFYMNSHSEAIERAIFFKNKLEENYYFSDSCENVNKDYERLSSVIKFRGLQKVTINRNLFLNNAMQFNIIAGIETRKANDFINAKENWWGSKDASLIMESIFDFDDWNNHILVEFRPYLKSCSCNARLSNTEDKLEMNLDNIGGRLFGSMTLKARKEPYLIQRDLTIMPNATLIIEENSLLQFAPNVGILVLGSLKAIGRKGKEIILLPLHSEAMKCSKLMTVYQRSNTQIVRLCNEGRCTSHKIGTRVSGGFLEVFDAGNNWWLPTCDPDFTIRNAEVICRELDFSSLGPSIDYHLYKSYVEDFDIPWPAPRKCNGNESKYQDCPNKTNITGYACTQESLFVQIHCNEKKVETMMNHWGGIRFARSEFEIPYESQNNSKSQNPREPSGSLVQHVKILHAGSLHMQKSPAIHMIHQSATVHQTNIASCISDGIHIISSAHDIQLFQNRIEAVEGTGIAIASLGVHNKGSEDTSLQTLFGVLNICGSTKVIQVVEHILLHFRYDNTSIVCLKTFRSLDKIKRLGIRFVNFNWSSLEDSIIFYDGDIHNTSTRLMPPISGTSSMFSSGRSLSIKLIISKHTKAKDFIAEIFTVPIPVHALENHVQYNISSCIVRNNSGGGIIVSGTNPEVHMEWNRISGSCILSKTTNNCKAAVTIDVQNSKSIVFKDNLVENNQGGLLIHAISTGSAKATNGWITNNLFSKNILYPALHINGNEADRKQEIMICRNYFTENHTPNNDIIIISDVNTNFSGNTVTHNNGTYILKIAGNKRMHPEKPSLAANNYFYMNTANSTILADTSGLQFSGNMLLNPESTYEITSVSTSLFDFATTPVDARNNWWGQSNTKDVMNRIYDNSVNSKLLPVTYIPFYTNEILMQQKCAFITNTDADHCSVAISIPVTFAEANKFCGLMNASLAYVWDKHLQVLHIEKEEQMHYHTINKIWVLDARFTDKCTILFNQTVQSENCQELHSFICVSNDSDDWSDSNGPKNWNMYIFIGTVIIVSIVIGLLCSFKKLTNYCRMQNGIQEATAEFQEMPTIQNPYSAVRNEENEGIPSEGSLVHGSESIFEDPNSSDHVNYSTDIDNNGSLSMNLPSKANVYYVDEITTRRDEYNRYESVKGWSTI